MLNSRIYFYLALTLIVPSLGCGKKATDSTASAALTTVQVSCSNTQMYGIWNSIDDNSRADILTMTSGCQGKSTYCGSEFYYSSEFGNEQFVLHVVKTNGNATCPSVGDHICSFGVNLISNLPGGPISGATSNVTCDGSRIYARIGMP